MAYRGGGITPFGGGLGSLFGLRRDIDRLFEDTFSGRAAGGQWVPAVNVREAEGEICLDVELPGIKPENVEISVENGMLSVSGEKREERKEGEEGRYHLVERSYGSFTRSFQLPAGIDEEQISADFENGLLTVRIPKAALPQPRRVQIRGGQQQRQRQQVTGRGEEGSSQGEQPSERGSGGRGEGRGSTRGGSQGQEGTSRRTGQNVQQ